MHIGSQIVQPGPYRAAFERLAELVAELRRIGFPVRHLDLGGGIGIPYHQEATLESAAYAKLVRETFAVLDVDMACEPGRFLCGPAGLLIARVIYIKSGASKRFVILDAAMNDLIRPALYDAWHDIIPVRLPATPELTPADVVGPVCETGDTFAVDRDLPALAEDDLVAFNNAGAYGAVMSSTYNSRPLVPEVLVSGDRFAVIRARPSYDVLLAMDTIPDWLDDSAIANKAVGRKRGTA
jgi:diaminopimelate decarboxylase